MGLKIVEVQLADGNVDLFFEELTKREDFEVLLKKLLEIKGVRIVKETEDETKKACLLEINEFQFVLVHDSDSFVWNYIYAVKRENHSLLRQLCERIAEVIL